MVEAEETALREKESCEVQLVCRGGNRWSRHRAVFPSTRRPSGDQEQRGSACVTKTISTCREAMWN